MFRVRLIVRYTKIKKTGKASGNIRESWTITVADEEALRYFEGRTLQSIFGPVHEDGE